MPLQKVLRDKKGSIIGLALLVTLGAGQNILNSAAQSELAFIPNPSQYIGISLDPRIIKRLLGLRMVFADLIQIDTFIKADMTHEDRPYTTLYRAFRNVIMLDPDNVESYYLAGLYLSVIKDDIKGASAILRDGARYIDATGRDSGDGWKIMYTLGYNLMIEEGEVVEGAEWIQKAASSPHSSLVVKALAKRVSTEQGRLEIASRVLQDVYRNLTKPDEKKKIEHKLTLIAAQQELLDLNEKFEKFLANTEAYALKKDIAFKSFLRSIVHGPNDLLGRPLKIGPVGKIVADGNK